MAAVGDLQELRAVLRDQLLVGGDHVLAPLEAGAGIFVGGLESADHLDDDRNAVVVQDDVEVLDEPVGVEAVGEIAHIEDVLEIELLSRLSFKALLIFEKHVDNAGTDGAAAQNRDVDHDMVPPNVF